MKDLLTQYKNMIRIGDVILIIIFALGSMLPVVLFTLNQLPIEEGTGIWAIISINGLEVDRFELGIGNSELITYTVEDGLSGQQFNLVEIDDYRIRVKRDNSPDQIGVNMGWASWPGQTIIVLPHRFLIRIEQIEGANPDDIILPF